MKLYREKIRQADGTLRQSDAWYIEWRDHKRVRRRWAGYKSKQASAELGRRLEQLADVVASGASLTETQARWVDSLKAATRKRLARIGMLGGEIVRSSGSLSRHIADYENHLKAKRNKAKSIDAAIRACRQIIEGIHAIDLTQITAGTVEDWLRVGREVGYATDGRSMKPLSVSWSNHHLTYIKGLCRWMVKTDRSDRNPLDNLSKLNADADPRHHRAVLTAAQTKKLLKHAKATPDRYWLYRLALETGLRANELRQLTVGAFSLGKSPSVRVSAAYTKSGRTDVIPLAADTAKGIKGYFARKMPSAAALVVPEKTARLLKEDLAACGIADRTPDGLVIDFHALRHTFLTNIGYHASSFADLQALARHSKNSAAITMLYAHPEKVSMRKAIESARRAVK